ncbi:MAG: polymorphic toxin type 44 domain-containing protein [Anaerolineales bacterium]
MKKKRLTYKVQRGDDFTKIADKLYGDRRYRSALMRQNPHIKKVVPGIVIDLLDDDPKEMWKKRERGQRRQDLLRKKNWERIKLEFGINPDLRDIEPITYTIETPQTQPPEELIPWWEDPDFQTGLIGLVESTAQDMGMDSNLMLDELGFGEGSRRIAEAPTTAQIEPQTTSPSTSTQPSSPTSMTDEQKKELKKELGNMGLDADVAMYELGLSENDPLKPETTGLPSESLKENLGNEAREDKNNQTDVTEWLVEELKIQTPSMLDEIEQYNELSPYQEGAGLGYPWWLYGSHFNMFTDYGRYDIDKKMSEVKEGAVALCGDHGCKWVDSSVPGNIMFGYLSAARGINQDLAWVAGGIVQIKSTGEINPDYIGSFFDNPKDKEAVDFGYSLYNECKGDLTIEKFKAALTMDKLNSFQEPPQIPGYPAIPQANTYPPGHFLYP